MRTVALIAMSIAVLVFSSYLSSHYPAYLNLFIILQFVVTLPFLMAVAWRGTRTMQRDLEYISGGRRLFVASKEVVSRFKARDRELQEERKKTSSLSIITVPFFIIFMLLFLTPEARDYLLRSIEVAVGQMVPQGEVRSFIAHLTFFSSITAILQATTLTTQRLQGKRGGAIQTPSSYVVTDRGLILDGSFPLRAPIRVMGTQASTRRRFVELKVRDPSPLGRGVVRIRLYTDNPHMLEAQLKPLLTKEGS